MGPVIEQPAEAPQPEAAPSALQNQVHNSSETLIQARGQDHNAPNPGVPVSQSFSRESSFRNADSWREAQAFVQVSLTSGIRPHVPPSIGYRALWPSDLGTLQAMHEALFPIKYEADFFNNAVTGRGIISWAAVDRSRGGTETGQLIGFVTAKVVTSGDPEVQESDILAFELKNANQTMIYILTLGIAKPYRNLGIASTLIWQVIQHASAAPLCKAVFLHVIDYNTSGIMFYKRNGFQCIRRLASFYQINSQFYDAFLYVYYVNGGSPPYSPLGLFMLAGSYLKSLCVNVGSYILDLRNSVGDKRSKWRVFCGPFNSRSLVRQLPSAHASV